jgi:hypothetical protein
MNGVGRRPHGTWEQAGRARRAATPVRAGVEPIGLAARLCRERRCPARWALPPLTAAAGRSLSTLLPTQAGEASAAAAWALRSTCSLNRRLTLVPRALRAAATKSTEASSTRRSPCYGDDFGGARPVAPLTPAGEELRASAAVRLTRPTIEPFVPQLPDRGDPRPVVIRLRATPGSRTPGPARDRGT